MNTSENFSTKRPKVIIWDVDETIIDKTSWIYLIEGVNADQKAHMEKFRKFMDGLVGYDDVRSQIMSNLTKRVRGNITRGMILDICKNVPIKPEMFSILPTLLEFGYQMCLISAGIDLFVQNIAERLGVEYWYANSRLQFDEQDNFIDFHFVSEMDDLKVQQLKVYLLENNLKPADCIAIGDGKTDKGLFEKVRGIALNSQDDSLNTIAWKKVSQLSELVELLQ
jgi:HAD superfamily phosphoserine phosphatase-like hydrolase